MDKFERLLKDVEAGYATGLEPVSEDYGRVAPYGTIISGCALAAAYVAKNGRKCDPDFRYEVLLFAAREYGLDRNEKAGFILGFDGKPIRPGDCPAAYAAGQQARQRFIVQAA